MRKYFRFISDLRKIFKSGISPEKAVEEAKKTLAKRWKNRSANFLSLVEKGIFGYPKSPYRNLLDQKKIVFDDIKKQVEANGIEATLKWLFEENVYFTVDEFKEGKKVVRKGLQFHCSEEQFDNPFLSTAYEVRSGATRSAGTRVRIDFDYLVQRSLYDAFLLNEHNILKSPIANWFPLFPGAPGINSSLRFSHIGNPPHKWFSQVDKSQVKVSWKKRLGTKTMFLFSKFHGVPLAAPEYVDLNQAHKITRWAIQTVEKYGTCAIYTFASSAVRVCIAAQEKGQKLDGVHFLVTGEPLTPQKKQEIESVGAKTIPVYGISEVGVIAAGCTQPYTESDHTHLYEDSTALITRRCKVPHSGTEVDSFFFTTILFESPKLLLNVGMGDHGKVFHQSCDCAYGKLGFTTHVANIRSYEKLTGEGVTFVGTDFLRIIEHDLPKKFGGQSTDYQLIEEEDDKGLNRLLLLVSPRLGEIHENNLVNAFIQLLSHSKANNESWAQSGSEMWKQARMVGIKREYPLPTPSGKIFPFHIKKNEKAANAG